MLFQCNLVPTDEITVYYNVKSEGRYLNNVIESHTEFIFATIKAPLKPYPVSTSDKILIQEQIQVSSKFCLTTKRFQIRFYFKFI
jgi:isoleucyl-tRNA synthetase